MSGGSHAWNSSFANNYHGAWGSTTYYGGGSGSGSGYGGSESTGGTSTHSSSFSSASGTTWSYPFYSSTPANPPGSGSGGPYGDGKQRWDGVNLSSQPSTGPDLPSALPPSVGVPDLGIGGIAGLESLGLAEWDKLSDAEAFWDAGDLVTDAFAWAGDQLSDLYDTASQRIEDAGVWASATFSNGIEIAGSLITGMIDAGEAVLGALAELPGMVSGVIDAISNMSASDILDGVQVLLDVGGLVPVAGEPLDAINGVISLARGDNLGAALSFASMFPIVGDLIGKGGKIARFLASKTDDVMAAAPSTIVGRRGAFRGAKRDTGIPTSQQPDSVIRTPLTDRNGKAILGSDGKPTMTREYIYTRPDGSKVVIQDHSAGHSFDGVRAQGPHFNVRPPENTRTGKVPRTQPHYPFDR